MYKFDKNHQFGLADFNQPMGLKMNPENRWVKKAEKIPWEAIEEKYAALFPGKKGMLAKPLRTALGSLLIQKQLQFSDRELVEEIRENPYFQYFIGLPGYQDTIPFVPSLLVEFRKRLTAEVLEEIDLCDDLSKQLATIRTLVEQQQYMYENKVHSVPDRIVSISQPYIRPIARGKAKAPVEFGAKLDLSIDENGIARLERLSFDAYNESDVFITAVENYKSRTGHYPERVLVDQIYRNRTNRAFCSEHGIRISGPALGRPKKDNKVDKKQEYIDNNDRIEVERAFSLAKRRYGLGLITAKLDTKGKKIYDGAVKNVKELCDDVKILRVEMAQGEKVSNDGLLNIKECDENIVEIMFEKPKLQLERVSKYLNDNYLVKSIRPMSSEQDILEVVTKDSQMIVDTTIYESEKIHDNHFRIKLKDVNTQLGATLNKFVTEYDIKDVLIKEPEISEIKNLSKPDGNKTTDRSIIDAIDMDYNTCIVWKSFVAYG